MLKKIVLATALIFATATTAFADQCTDTMKTVEEAAATAAPDAKAKADDLLTMAKEKQAAGDEKACVTLLTEAAKVLSTK